MREMCDFVLGDLFWRWSPRVFDCYRPLRLLILSLHLLFRIEDQLTPQRFLLSLALFSAKQLEVGTYRLSAG